MNRAKRLRSLLEKHELDLILVYSTCNDARFFRWLTGSACRSGCNYLHIDRESLGWLELSYHLSDLPRIPAASVQLVDEIDEIPAALAALTKPYSRIGVIGDVPFWHLEHSKADLRAIKEDGDALLWVKSEEEIEQLAQLGARLVREVGRAATEIRIGVTEQSLADTLRSYLHADGGREAFPTSIVSGERLKTTTLGAPSNRAFSAGDSICIDCGIESCAIFSDCTRMYFLEGSPLAVSYHRLCAIQESVIAKIAPLMTFGEIAMLFEKELISHGFTEHNLRLAELGHGIGFALHEPPFLMNSRSEHIQVIPGMVFTLEPEITVNGYQLRVEDMVALTVNGAVTLTA